MERQRLSICPCKTLDVSRLCFEECLQAFLKTGFTEYPLVKGKACPQMPVTYYGSWWLLCTIKRAQTSCLLAACHPGGRCVWEGGSEGSRAFTLPCKLSFWTAYACHKGSAWAQSSAHISFCRATNFLVLYIWKGLGVCVLACGKNTCCIALILFLP